MAIGAEDLIDKLLVKKYATQKMNNHEGIIDGMIDPVKMMDAMNDYATVQRNMFALSNKVANICAQVNAKARYNYSSQIS